MVSLLPFTLRSRDQGTLTGIARFLSPLSFLADDHAGQSVCGHLHGFAKMTHFEINSRAFARQRYCYGLQKSFFFMLIKFFRQQRFLAFKGLMPNQYAINNVQ